MCRQPGRGYGKHAGGMRRAPYFQQAHTSRRSVFVPLQQHLANDSMKHFLILLAAIACEVVATSALKQTGQFTRLVPSLVTLAGYAAAFYLLSIVLRYIPLGIAYANLVGCRDCAGITCRAVCVQAAPGYRRHNRHLHDYRRGACDKLVFKIGGALTAVCP